MLPGGLAYMLFCKPKLALRGVKPDPRSRGDGQSSSRTGAYSPSPACLHLSGIRFPKAEKYTHPRVRKGRNKGKRNEFKVMEDALTLVLIIVLCLLLKPLVAAILRGLGSSEHRRDR